MSRPALPAAIAAALVLAAPAAAHVIVSPAFLASGSTETIELSVPNELEVPMTGFVVTAPPGLEIVGADEVEGWDSTVDGRMAAWAGGSLPANVSETFGVRLQPTAEPGSLDLLCEQQYADGNLRWSVTLTIVPGPASSDSGGSTLVVGLIVAVGGLVTAAIALLAWRRRTKSLQER